MPLGGCLTIKTYQLDNKVILEVQDKGEGIKKEILDKIGTPFFTTKEKGTGLGLAVCKSIITQHNAQLDIQSSPEGSNFRVIFNIGS
ncbi:Sporulation kinase C (fragment) [Candidatus Desulfosporosinus infrequens]|uniref:histidine kinase n=1 Tax=Candidatus Desulfosporosinus infrequens TaxID=2043169 RepID=A0A2U3LYR2_9FIRM